MKTPLLRLMFSAALAVCVLSGTCLLAAPVYAQAAENWKKEFDDICSRTDDAMSLQTEDLKQLVGRCDALRPSIEKLDETQRKIYSKKLQMCRDLFTFVLSTK